MLNAALPRYGQCNRQAPQLFELLACNGNFLWEGVREGYLFLKKRYPSLYPRPPHQCRRITNFCAAENLDVFQDLSGNINAARGRVRERMRDAAAVADDIKPLVRRLKVLVERDLHVVELHFHAVEQRIVVRRARIGGDE